MRTTVLLAGMRTVHCVRAVRTALAALDGVPGATVEQGRAVIDHLRPLDEGAVRAALAPTGYTITSIVTDARILPIGSS